MNIYALFLLCQLYRYSYETDGLFLEVPTTAIVAEQDDGTALFRCQANANDVIWRFNGTAVDYSNRDFDRIYVLSTAGPRISILTIAAKPVYNDTPVQCIAIFYNSSQLFESTPVLLLIQGLPANVTNVSATLTLDFDLVTLHLQWDPVFSLNISNQEPDLLYCVAISAAECSTNELFSLHSAVVFESHYVYSIVPTNLNSVVIRITPLNVVGSGGTSNPFNVTIHLVPESSHAPVGTAVYFSRQGEVNISLTFLETDDACRLRTVDIYTIYVSSNDSGESLTLVAERVMQSTINQLVHLSIRASSDHLPQSRKYFAVIEGENSAGRANITEAKFGTHHVLMLSISNSTLSGTILLNATFTRGSNAIGYLAVLVGDDGSYIFTVSYRPDDVVTISGLPRSMYNAAVFDIGASGVPASLAASTAVFFVPMKLSTILMQGSFAHNISTGVKKATLPGMKRETRGHDPNFSVQKTSQDQVCITCSFPATSRARGCIALIHSPANQAELRVQTISRSVSNKSSTSQFSSIAESQCLEVSGADSVAVAVFVWTSDGVIAQSPSTVQAAVMAADREDTPPHACDSKCIYVVLSASICFLAVILTMGVVAYLALRYRKNARVKTKSSEIEMRRNSAYEEHVPRHVLTVEPPATEPVYETVV